MMKYFLKVFWFIDIWLIGYFLYEIIIKMNKIVLFLKKCSISEFYVIV